MAKASDRRKQMKEELAARQAESYANRESSGKFKSIFNRSALGSIGMWKCSEEEHFINIIPSIAGKHNPNVPAGKTAFVLDVYVHQKVGVNEDSYLCLAKNYNKKCPICEEQLHVRKQEDFDDAYVKSLNPKRRVIYNIQCIDTPQETAKGIQIWEVSHWLFHKELDELSKIPRGGGYVPYSNPDEGKVVCFRKKGKGPTNTEYKAFQFVDRDEPISDELLDAALCLDDLLHIPTYNEVKNAFYGSEIEDEVEEEVEETPPPIVPKKFVCPGDRPNDFGEIPECDECPYTDDCEAELAELSEKKVPEPPKVVTPENDAVEGRRARRRPGA